MGPPVLVLNANQKRETGRRAQLSNITSAKAVADVIRTSLGPKAMLKMILDTMGSIVITNDGNSILREIDVNHPAAKSMIELAKCQDEEVGDGTTSVVILAGEVLACAEPLIKKELHPTVIISGFTSALNDALEYAGNLGFTINVNNREEMMSIIRTCIGTKFTSRWSDIMCNLAIDSIRYVATESNGVKEADIKRNVKVEKIPGGSFGDSYVLKGVMVNKDVLHASMRRRIENPRIIILDSPLEYKKGESQTDVEVVHANDFATMLKLEEEAIEQMCAQILKHKPDIVITEKGISDLAQHHLVKHGVTCLRRFRKTDTNRISRACGATIVSRPDEIEDKDVGIDCGLFEVRKIADEYFSFFEECKDPKACSIVLRGASKDVLNETERNLMDALCVARNVILDPRLVPGGGAFEMSVSNYLRNKASMIEGVGHYPYEAIANALEVIPRTLSQNCGAKTVRVITELRAKYAGSSGIVCCWGIDGEKGVCADMKDLGVIEPLQVKLATLKTAIESSCMLLRVDDILSGIRSKAGAAPSSMGAGGAPNPEEMDG